MAADGPDRAPETAFVPVNPYALARNEAAALQIKRFYTEVATAAHPEGGFAVLLDGRPARTPQRQPIVLPTRAAADLVAAEFSAQVAVMQPADMVVYRLVNAVIDGVAATSAAVHADVVRYASADLLLYRAEEPDELVRQQARAWDPVLDWARDDLGARFYLAAGVVHVAQPDHAMDAVDRAVSEVVGGGAGQPFRLGALHLMTTLMGSALLALGALAGRFAPEDAWRRAHVDEEFQTSRWGRDEEAEARGARRWADMQAAGRLIEAVPRLGERSQG